MFYRFSNNQIVNVKSISSITIGETTGTVFYGFSETRTISLPINELTEFLKYLESSNK